MICPCSLLHIGIISAALLSEHLGYDAPALILESKKSLDITPLAKQLISGYLTAGFTTRDNSNMAILSDLVSLSLSEVLQTIL